MSKDYYSILGVSKKATDDQIKKAYRKMALRYHPDKNNAPGAEEHFKLIAEAYSVLGDAQKKADYDNSEGVKAFTDTGGSDGFTTYSNSSFNSTFYYEQSSTGFNSYEYNVPQNEPYNFNMHTPYQGCNVFGMGGYSRPYQPPPANMYNCTKDIPVIYTLDVSLEEIFTGCTKTIKIFRRRLNPDGWSVRMEDKILTVNIKRGCKEGTKIVFPMEGHESPTTVAADVVFVIKDMPHPVFRREGSDIVYPVSISLREALCGYTINIPTLDARTISVTSKDIVKPGTKRRIIGQGLPLSRTPMKRGDIILDFRVTFPDHLSESLRSIVQQIFPL